MQVNDIDKMDIAFFMRLMAHQEKKEEKKEVKYIDQLGIF